MARTLSTLVAITCLLSSQVTIGHRISSKKRSSAGRGGTGLGVNLFVDSPFLSSKLSGRLSIASDTDFLHRDHLKVSEGDVLVVDSNHTLVNSTLTNSNETLSEEELLKLKKKEDAKLRRQQVNLWPNGRVVYRFHPSISKFSMSLIS